METSRSVSCVLAWHHVHSLALPACQQVVSHCLSKRRVTSSVRRRSVATPRSGGLGIHQSPRCAMISPLPPASAATSSPAKRIVASDLTTNAVEEGLLSPMMQHYVQTKRKLSESLGGTSHREVLLMYRVGDFFESFFEDAVLLSSTCELALTSKDAGKALGSRIPMAGVPHYAIDEKIKMLLARNVTVAVVDQVQSAAETPSGKLVKRAVTRLITPGTASDDSLLNAKKCSYLAALVVKWPGGKARARKRKDLDDSSLSAVRFGFSFADVSTGEFKVTDGEGLDTLQRLLVNVAPAELLLVTHPNQEGLRDRITEEVRNAGTAVVTYREPHDLASAEEILTAFHSVDNVESIGCRGRPLCIEAGASLLSFTHRTLAVDIDHEHPLPLNCVKTFAVSDVMLLDAACLRNMEVVETARDGCRDRTLQWAVDRTVTSMGARCLRSWLLAPSMSIDTIRKRQSIVEALMQDRENRRALVQVELRNIADLERLGGRVGACRATPRELRWLSESILRLPAILKIVKSCIAEAEIIQSVLAQPDSGCFVREVDDQLLQLAKEVSDELVDPAPSSLLSDMVIRGGAVSKENWDLSSAQIFRSGYNDELDALRRAIDEPEQWISVLEDRERKKTGIDSIRIKHIKNTGYVLRIPRSVGERKMDEAPTFFMKLGYERVQSTKAELRFRFEELKAHEKLHNSELSEILLLELRLFEKLRIKFSKHVPHMREVAQQIAAIDVLAGFAQIAEEQHYVKPEVLDQSERILNLEDARHPVVEQTLPVGKTFVPNSFQLGAGRDRSYADLMVLCGPNAAGKSCALRSVGLICILAQSGCFVPARFAQLSLCDRIFTRVGAVDDLARGQSTFQVEMAETACILSHVTPSSLVLLDEIGRGTSTVDGIAIAWSVSEHLAKRHAGEGTKAEPPRSMFVTHYHELNQLASLHANVQSFRLEMAKRKRTEDGKSTHIEWITTHKVVPGASFESLGLAIAQRAGFPKEVMDRAKEIVSFLRAPSHALGAELRQALLTNSGSGKVSIGPDIYAESYVEENDEGAKLQQGKESVMYKKGFEDGYERARAELYQELRKAMTRLEPRANVEC